MWELGISGILLIIGLLLAAVCLKTVLCERLKIKASAILLRMLSVLPLFILLSAGLLGCAFPISHSQIGEMSNTTQPVMEWDPSPSAVVIEAARPIHNYHPSLSIEYTRNYIPEGRLFGDGHIVWAIYADDGGRSVMEGYLTRGQIVSLLQEFVDKGFFGWKDSYSSRMPYDNPPSDYLTVNLTSVKKTVRVTMTEPPPGYAELFERIGSGAGASGTPFQPIRGTLIIWETAQEAQAIWDQIKYPLDLTKATEEGIPLEGEALNIAWELVNKNPLGPPVIQIGELNYKFFLLIPGLMYDLQ